MIGVANERDVDRFGRQLSRVRCREQDLDVAHAEIGIDEEHAVTRRAPRVREAGGDVGLPTSSLSADHRDPM